MGWAPRKVFRETFFERVEMSSTPSLDIVIAPAVIGGQVTIQINIGTGGNAATAGLIFLPPRGIVFSSFSSSIWEIGIDHQPAPDQTNLAFVPISVATPIPQPSSITIVCDVIPGVAPIGVSTGQIMYVPDQTSPPTRVLDVLFTVIGLEVANPTPVRSYRPNATTSGSLLNDVGAEYYPQTIPGQPQVTGLTVNGVTVPVPATNFSVAGVASITVAGSPPYNYTFLPYQNTAPIVLEYTLGFTAPSGSGTYTNSVGVTTTFQPLAIDFTDSAIMNPDFFDVDAQGTVLTGRLNTEGTPGSPYALVPSSLTPGAGTLVVTNPTTGAFTFTPSSTFTGTASFRFNSGSTLNLVGAIEVEPTLQLYSTGTVSVPENTVTVATPFAALLNPTWTLSGPDAGAFQVNSTTSALEFRFPPDFETPFDRNRDNVYEVTVTATTQAATRVRTLTQALQVRVTDAGGPPLSLGSPLTLRATAGVPLRLPGVELEATGMPGMHLSQINGVALTGATQVIQVLGGIVRVAQGMVVFTARAGFTGTVQIPYLAVDVVGGTPTAGIFIIQVTAGGRPPFPVSSSSSGSESESGSGSGSSESGSESERHHRDRPVKCRPVQRHLACPPTECHVGFGTSCCMNYAPWILLLIAIIVVAALLARKHRLIRF
jgi:hypothetical protein